MKPSSSKNAPMTPRSLMNQRKAVESRGVFKTKTPGASDENKRPNGGLTPGTPTSHFMWKNHQSRRDGVTPLGVNGRANRKVTTPSTPTRVTPVKSQQTPTRSERTVLFEFEDNLLLTPANNEVAVSISHTSTVQIDPTPSKAQPTAPTGTFNRSRSASSLTRSKKTASMKMRRSHSEARLPSENVETNSESEDGELSRIAVGVRVRPLQTREHGNTVLVEGNEVKVASELGSVHSFPLDHVFGPNITQEHIYNTMVKPLLDSAFQGYNACLFAYGQTGSGKTYSMMGDETEVDGIGEKTGIIPRFCHELIKKLSTSNDESGDSVHTSTSVEVSYLEVYNEKIRDLLIQPPSQPLRVREHPVYGPYVADLSKHSVNTFSDIQHWITEGNKQRVIAATEMNEKSSRSHSLFKVVLTQSIIQSDGADGWTHEHTRRSQINLVDLAGSERIAHSSVSSDRLREGVSINRSLMTLGKVISALVDKRSFVPYRESILTWLLKESLGGNSRTSMLATVSPCSSHQDETMATLRYATQARSILNTARVNESPQNKIIRELRAEIERLKVFVDSEHSRPSSRVMSPVEERPNDEVVLLKNEIKSMQETVEGLKGQLVESERTKGEVKEKEDKIAREEASELKKTKEELENLKRRFEELVLDHEKCLEICNEKEQAAEAFKRRAQTGQNDRAELQKRLDARQEEVRRLNEAVEELAREKNSWSEKLELMEKSVQDWKSDLEAKNTVEDELRRRAEAAELEVAQWRERVAAYEEESFERLGKTNAIAKDVETWKKKIYEIKTESETLSKTVEEERGQKEHWKAKYEQCCEQMELLENKHEKLEEKLEDTHMKLDGKQREMDEWVRKKENLEKQMAETSNELEEVRENLRTISVQVETTDDVAKISVSVQTSIDLISPDSDDQDLSDSLTSQKKEYMRLKKKVLEKKKRLEVFNAKLMKFEVEHASNEKSSLNQSALNEALRKIKDLEDTIRKQKEDMDEMIAELDLLRELEIKYKNKLDRSLLDSEEAWNKKYTEVNDSLNIANCEVDNLKKQLAESQEQVNNFIDRLSQSNLDRQVLAVGNNSIAKNKKEIELLERRCCDLQLKLDQKNNLICELEKISNRAKEEQVVAQTFVTEVTKQFKQLENSLEEEKNHNASNSTRIDELETQLGRLQEELEKARKEKEEIHSKFTESIQKNSEGEKTLKERDQQLVELHNQLITVEKMLQDQMSIKFEALKSYQRQESLNRDELDKRDVVAVENIRYKSELESTKEQLGRKKKRLEAMKTKIDKLEDLLITTMRESTERKNYMLIKREHSKVFDCMMDHSYLFHWEYLVRKARTYAHKYHIPYEFEKNDDVTVIVRHLLYNAKSYWFRVDFQLWFQNIEKNDKWCRELDEKLPWEADFGNYFNIPSEKPGALCPIDESACQDIELYCCKPDLICPGVWKKTIVHRHLGGLRDDTRCLLVYFKSSKKQEIVELLQVIDNLAEQINDKLSSKT